jgi:hypothetical protein
LKHFAKLINSLPLPRHPQDISSYALSFPVRIAMVGDAIKAPTIGKHIAGNWTEVEHSMVFDLTQKQVNLEELDQSAVITWSNHWKNVSSHLNRFGYNKSAIEYQVHWRDTVRAEGDLSIGAFPYTAPSAQIKQVFKHHMDNDDAAGFAAATRELACQTSGCKFQSLLTRDSFARYSAEKNKVIDEKEEIVTEMDKTKSIAEQDKVIDNMAKPLSFTKPASTMPTSQMKRKMIYDALMKPFNKISPESKNAKRISPSKPVPALEKTLFAEACFNTRLPKAKKSDIILEKSEASVAMAERRALIKDVEAQHEDNLKEWKKTQKALKVCLILFVILNLIWAFLLGTEVGKFVMDHMDL